MSTKPIRVWLAPPGPNPWKVVLVLEELQIPYEIKSIKFQDIKTKPLIDLNPNGRVPAIEDPNTGLVLWETGAIILYLVEQYDVVKKLTYGSLQEKSHVQQWLMFQVSGQGPYYGQASWFHVLHSEKLPSAVNRYVDEVKRVCGVLEQGLTDKKWLVGDKMTIADLAFVPWNDRLDVVLMCPAESKFDGFPRVKAWHESMIARPSWKKAMDTRAKLMDEQGLMWNGMPKDVSNMEEYQARIRAEKDAKAEAKAST
ncbi:glutathione S-transferase II [Melanomma pulvis-pyrius CBS 109.77]|uniref:glutathione transferase n=1 Tax=Melanomma pulvis-pyrius CBS 109.77 TaxID=1314802 RepID=A0A6A6WX70_9PLEO|nr:glutathione S-transferase II [Melanomma pulvis-pyrius CBS 109.77]